MIVDDCSREIRNIYQPGTRYLGRMPSGQYRYETVIEYRRQPGDAEHSYYDLFEKPTELCFHIQTIEMVIVSRGNTFRLQLNDDIRIIAEGE